MPPDTFDDLDSAVDSEGYSEPTPIQAQAIPYLLEGRDLLGVAQTGTGKTAAFALPILQRLGNARRASPGHARVLVLTPTRELAIQIDESFATYGKNLRRTHTVVFGGVNQRAQVEAMQPGVDVLVATPGRLLDLMGQGYIELGEVGIFVLDEADRMLDMGFIHDVRRVIDELPEQRQTLLFSATMPEAISQLSQRILRDPVRVEVTPESTTVELVIQRVMLVERKDKIKLLADVLEDPAVERALVFTRTKHGANKVVKLLDRVHIVAAAIHGNKSQTARQNALDSFKAGRTRVLVATDLAARGIDVEGISHVINYDLPNIPESYVHRIGRTARAGHDGIAISFCEVEERPFLRDIERLIRQRIEIVRDHPFESTVPFEDPKPAQPVASRSRRPRGQGPRSRTSGRSWRGGGSRH
jgi:ATP-dependent RNA helicase RhlE